MEYNYNNVRRIFIDFFQKLRHHYIEPSLVVNKNDPTLMFTNAGMNQFKGIFLGDIDPKYNRVVNSQPCLRVSGKHNDLEEVGLDTYHHTLFEMLGNWSFGDYFKEKAISLAWQLLTNIFKLPQDRIYITIFKGDEKDNLPEDNEAASIWERFVDKEKIIYCSKRDNFWEMGQTGPCGPCSEIHFDMRHDSERKKIDGKTLVNKDNPLVIEIWNLVFIQFNRLASGKLENLSQKHVDTGMGFERLLMVLQEKTSTYDTDIFQEIIQFICKETNFKYGENSKIDIAIRVIADHSRAITLTIAEGTIPSNTAEGYVIRRILRRAVRYAYSYLNIQEPFLFKLVTIIARQFENLIPNIKKVELNVMKVIQEEEKAFIKTLSLGLKRLDVIMQSNKSSLVDGKKAFELYDTYGFPLDLTTLILKENSLEVDEKGFNIEMKKQKTRSKKSQESTISDWILVTKKHDEIEFVGYDRFQTESKIIKYQKINERDKTFFKLVLDKTPFYPEGGGQMGDRGYILTHDNIRISIFDTKKENEIIVHYAESIPEKLDETFVSSVNIKKRELTSNNHTATHLLHAALCNVLGDHVNQKGSFLDDKILRFDFNHFAKLNDEELLKVEAMVNTKIRENIPLHEKREFSKAMAIKMGAKAFFGEKYGDKVRVVIFDENYSVELCGGTHAKTTGQLGYFKIISENSVSAGIRRIEAITADAFDEYLVKNMGILRTTKEILKNPKDITKTIYNLLEEKKLLEKQIKIINTNNLKKLKNELSKKIKDHTFEKFKKYNVLIEKIEISDLESFKNLAFDLKRQNDPLLLILVAKIEKKAQILMLISDEIVSALNLDASIIIKELSKYIEGGGGGQAFFATAGGKNLNGIDKVIIEANDYLKNL